MVEPGCVTRLLQVATGYARAAQPAWTPRDGARWRPTIFTGGHHGDSSLSSGSDAAVVEALRR